MTRRRPLVGAAARAAISVALLATVAAALDPSAIAGRLAGLRVPWVLLALAISVLQVVVLAWRWRFTAGRLGIDLPWGAAVREYYLGVLLNQVLPGGIAGDVSRAWRHARSEAPAGAAVRAVILERASGQVVMTSVAALSLLALPIAWGSAARSLGALALVAVGALGLVAVVGLVALRLWMRSAGSLSGRMWADTHAALLHRDALPAQLASALLTVASYVAVFLAAARAVGVDTPVGLLLPLVAPVLMAMLLPVTVAGWGLREGAAAALWGLVGLAPEDGVAISVAYGLVVLLSALPGLGALMPIPSGGRGRRGRRDRGRSGGTEAAGPGPGSRSDPG